MAKNYETIIILKSDFNEEQINSSIEGVKALIDKLGGSLIHYEDWGKKKLAFKVKKQTKGDYHLFQFSGGPELLRELDRTLKLNEAVLRHMTVRMEARPKPADQERPAPPAEVAPAPLEASPEEG